MINKGKKRNDKRNCGIGSMLEGKGIVEMENQFRKIFRSSGAPEKVQ